MPRIVRAYSKRGTCRRCLRAVVARGGSRELGEFALESDVVPIDAVSLSTTPNVKVLPAVSYYNRGKISIDHPAQGGPFNNTTVEVVGVFCRGGLLARGKCAAGKAHNRVVGGQSHS